MQSMQVFPPQGFDRCSAFCLQEGGGEVAQEGGGEVASCELPLLEQEFVPHRGHSRCSGGAAVGLTHLVLHSAGIPCEPPPDIPNGKHSGRLQDEFHYGTAVTYTCNPGMALHGEPSIHCTTRDGQNGVWSEPLPACGGGAGLLSLQGPQEPSQCWNSHIWEG